MHHLPALTALLLVAGCQSAAVGVPAATQDNGVQALVTSVEDGDILKAKTSDGAITVRLLGIDAPEEAHDGTTPDCGAETATRTLKALVLHQAVTITTDPRSDTTDRYGRTLGYVDLGGDDVGLALIAAGMAEAWHPARTAEPTRHGTYQDAEEAARAARVGLWARCASIGR